MLLVLVALVVDVVVEGGHDSVGSNIGGGGGGGGG